MAHRIRRKFSRQLRPPTARARLIAIAIRLTSAGEIPASRPAWPSVAGLNFRLRLRVELGGQPRMVEAVVYRNLQGQHQLTSWQWLLSRRTQ